jgi:hypothetical protein
MQLLASMASSSVLKARGGEIPSMLAGLVGRDYNRELDFEHDDVYPPQVLLLLFSAQNCSSVFVWYPEEAREVRRQVTSQHAE